TTNSVRSKSAARVTASTALGSVLSSTDKDGFAKLDASTSGARLDPPIPHTTVRVRPARRAASVKRTSSSHCASEARGAVLHARPGQRRAWVWIGAGCVLFLAGQLVWIYYELVRRLTPPYPSLADVGYLGVYVCFLEAVTKLVEAAPRRRFDHELLIDTVLVTLTAGALAYGFLLKPLFDLAGSVPSLLTSIAWSIGGIGVLWLILVELLRHTRVPLAAAGVVTALGVLCVTNVVYATAALRGTFHSGGVLDLGWDAGLLLLAAA